MGSTTLKIMRTFMIFWYLYGFSCSRERPCSSWSHFMKAYHVALSMLTRPLAFG